MNRSEGGCSSILDPDMVVVAVLGAADRVRIEIMCDKVTARSSQGTVLWAIRATRGARALTWCSYHPSLPRALSPETAAATEAPGWAWVAAAWDQRRC